MSYDPNSRYPASPEDDGRIPPDRRTTSGSVAANRVDYRRSYWRHRSIERIQNWKPLDTPSAWMSYELQEALEKIVGDHARKKRTTLLRLAEAAGAGLPKGDVFAMKDTCTPQAWVKWQNDPHIATAFEMAQRLCLNYYDRIELEAGRLRQLQLASTRAEIVDMSYGATEELRGLLHGSNSDRIKLDAITEILDRAGEETASKSSQDVNLNVGRAGDVKMSDIRKRSRQRDAVVSGDTIEMSEAVDGGPPPPPLPDSESGMLMIEAKRARDSNGDGDWQDLDTTGETVDISEADG